MDYIQTLVDLLRSRPITSVVATNAVTALVAVYVISEGKPVKWVYKKLFQAVMAAVPASIMDAEQEKLRASIEKDVIGHALEDENVYSQLPAEGTWCRTELRLNWFTA